MPVSLQPRHNGVTRQKRDELTCGCKYSKTVRFLVEQRGLEPLASALRSGSPKEVGAVTGLVGAFGGLGGFFPPLVLATDPTKSYKLVISRRPTTSPESSLRMRRMLYSETGSATRSMR